MKNNILELKNISKHFAGVKALQDVSFSCTAGEVHVLVGENGAGKSTLLKIISGLHKPDSGEIYFKGKKMNFKSPQDAQENGIAMVYQELTVLPEMTVAQNIFLNDEMRNSLGIIKDKTIRKKVFELAQQYEIEVDPDELVRNLPIAKRQMVEILKVLVRDPELIIFDEPTSSLAREETDKLFRIICSLTQRGKTIIFISHRMEEIFNIGGRATVLKDGRFVATVDISETNQDEIIKLMVGRPLQNIFPPKLEERSTEKVFEVKNINVNKKLYDISFDVRKGEVLGIAGLQGHGQTELLDVLAGMHPKDTGKVFLNTVEINYKKSIQAIKAGIALVPEDRKTKGLLLTLSVKENIILGSLHLHHNAGFINEKKTKTIVDDMVKRLAIKTPSMSQFVCNLSGGNQQKVVLGKCLSIKPSVLLFNEPTRGIDVNTKQEFYRLMRNLAKDGVAVIMYSSDLMEVVGISDRVLVMYEGRISAEIDRDEISEESIMRGAVGMKKAGDCT